MTSESHQSTKYPGRGWEKILSWCILIGCYKILGRRRKTVGGHVANWTWLSVVLLLFLAATKQLYEWFSPSVRPSVHLSVCLSVTPFWLCSHHHIIMKFSGVITSDQSDVHAKGQGQRSRSQRSQPNLIVSGMCLQFEFTYDDEMMHIAW